MEARFERIVNSRAAYRKLSVEICVFCFFCSLLQLFLNCYSFSVCCYFAIGDLLDSKRRSVYVPKCSVC